MHLKGLLIFVIALLTAFPVKSQFRNILLSTQGDGESAVCNPSVAINARHPQNIVVCSLPANLHYTQDGGKTWETQKVSQLAASIAHPLVVSDPKGRFYFFHLSPGGNADESGSAGSHSNLVFQNSADGGATWSASEVITAPGKRIGHEGVAIDNKGNLYVTWTEIESGDTACASHVRFSMSKNGKKWSDPVLLSGAPGGCLTDGSMLMTAAPAVTFDGKVFATWAADGRIFLDRSFNGGDLWLSNDIPVAGQEGSGLLTVPGYGASDSRPVFLSDLSKSTYRGSLYLVWADQRNGEDDTDIWFTRSHNFGDNWSSPLRVNDDSKDKHQYLPAMALDQETGYLYIMYYDRRAHEDEKTDVYLAYSTNGGGSFKSVRINETPFIPQAGGEAKSGIHLSAQKGVIVPVWTQADGDKTSIWTAVIAHEDLVKTSAEKK